MLINKVNFEKLKQIGKMDIKDLIKMIPKKQVKIKFKKKEKLPKSVVTLDIGEKYIKIVVGRFLKDKLIIDDCIEIETPKNSVVDGKIANKYILKESIETIINKAGLSGKSAVVTTNSSQVINREVIIPRVEESELETVIRYEIQKYLPINLNNYEVQHIFKDVIINDNSENMVLSVIAFPRNIVKEYYDFLEEINLNPYALDITYNSIRKINKYSFAKEMQGTVAFIDMGVVSTNVAIFKEGKVDFTRIIKNGEGSRELLEDDYSVEKKKLYIGELINDLERVFKYYSNKNVGNKVERILIYGGISNLSVLEEYIEKQLNIKVKKIKSLNNVEFVGESSKEVMENKIELYLNAIGAVIRY